MCEDLTVRLLCPFYPIYQYDGMCINVLAKLCRTCINVQRLLLPYSVLNNNGLY